jgi:hypothetical protein
LDPVTVPLEADCGACAGLCCAAFAFEAGPDFAEDKDAGQVCRHLDHEHRCSIHSARVAGGYGGCVGYDCHGAGQRVVQTLFAGRSWRREPRLLAPMLDAFATARRVHRHLLLLREAARLPLGPEERARLAGLQEGLLAGDPSGATLPDTGTLTALERDVSGFLRSLVHHLAGHGSRSGKRV